MKESTIRRFVLLGIAVFLAAMFGIPYAAFSNGDAGNRIRVAQAGDRVYTRGDFQQREQVLAAIYAIESELSMVNDPLTTLQSGLNNRINRDSGRKDAGPPTRMRLDTHLALLHLADQSHIDVSREERDSHIRALDTAHGGRDKLKDKLKGFKITEQEFLDGLVEVLRVRKLQSFAVQHEMRGDLKASFEGLAKSQRSYDLRYVPLARGAISPDDKIRSLAYQAFYEAPSNKSAFTRPESWMYEAIWTSEAGLSQTIRAAATDDVLRAFTDKERAAVLAKAGLPPDAKPAGSGSSAAGSGSPAAGSGSPAAAGSGSPAAAGSGSPAAAGSGSPAAAGSGSPAAAGSGSPAAAGSGSPAAAGSGSPAAAGSGSGPAPVVSVTTDELLKTFRGVIEQLYVEQELPKKKAAMWDEVAKQLAADPQANLRALSRSLGLEYRRSPGPVTEVQLADKADRIPVVGDDFPKLVSTTAPGTVSAPITTPGGRYLIRVLAKVPAETKPYSSLDAAAIERAAYDQYKLLASPSLQTPAGFELEWIGAELASWAMPRATSTEEVTELYEQSAKSYAPSGAGKAPELALMRPTLERVLAQGATRTELENAIERVRDAASKHDPEEKDKSDKAKERKDGDPPTPDKPTTPAMTADQVQAAFDLKAAATRAGLEYHRLTVDSRTIAAHPLLADQANALFLSDHRPGWVSASYGTSGATMFFVRLLAKREPETLSFEAGREAVVRQLLEKQMTDAFIAYANDTKKKLLDGDFMKRATELKLRPVQIERVREPSDIAGLAAHEQKLVLDAVRSSGSDAQVKEGQVTDPKFDAEHTVAFIVQLVRIHQPTADEIAGYEIAQRVRESQMQTFGTRILDTNGWFGLMWFSGYAPYELWDSTPKGSKDEGDEEKPGEPKRVDDAPDMPIDPDAGN